MNRVCRNRFIDPESSPAVVLRSNQIVGKRGDIAAYEHAIANCLGFRIKRRSTSRFRRSSQQRNAPAAPRSHVDGDGFVNVGDPDDFRFRGALT